ncbi:MAG TPA: prolyl oligopeptidase family serine peptidase [Dyella sp.]|uniref:alpha/beta hydrolase family protein n=1 Tax=Dyella sp. TaxID=1869338 RepID=UPI002BD13474|nr:prolyl oligopeptidase family serine peptidase [Dyella sp.]HUB88552.1 prolyl oligopeptidase family serine peptidase [Dyella sp.]
MMKTKRVQVFAAALGLMAASFSLHADTIRPLTAADFAKRPPFSTPSMSPDGQYLAMAIHDDVNAAGGGKYEIGVFHLPDMKPFSRLDVPAKQVPEQIIWTSNTRLIIVPARQLGWLDAPQLTGDLIAVDYDGSHQQSMYGWVAAHRHGLPPGARGYFSGLPSKPNGHFYWTTSISIAGKAREGRTEIFDVDATTGTAISMGSFNEAGMRLIVHDGIARIAYGLDDQNRPLLFEHDSENQAWRKVPTSARSAIPLAISDDGKQVYWRYSADGGPYALAVSNFDLSNLKILASDSFGSVDEVYWTPYPHKPFAAMIDTGRPRVIYVDDDNSATIHKALSEQFPNLLIRFAAISEDGTRVLVRAGSDKDPGVYALFTLNPVSFKPLFRIAPQIDPQSMASRLPIRFAASDGQQLDGYLTLPARGAKLPLVLLPHGGPIDIRDHWDYDAWAQFLASRGYAVLQVNYRGSAGRGPNFQHAGYKQFGTGIQQDLLDGVRWAIAQGYADKDKVCVFGASFGGYSALMAPIRSPGTFKCAVDFAGISDFDIMADKSDMETTERGQNYFNQAIGQDEATLRAISPLYHLDQFNVPVLIVHGEEDPRVPLKNATKLRSALDKAGKPYEWLIKPKELHGFYSDEDNTDFLQHLQDFLGKYLGSAAK